MLRARLRRRVRQARRQARSAGHQPSYLRPLRSRFVRAKYRLPSLSLIKIPDLRPLLPPTCVILLTFVNPGALGLETSVQGAVAGSCSLRVFPYSRTRANRVFLCKCLTGQLREPAMELLLILLYASICVAVFKIF